MKISHKINVAGVEMMLNSENSEEYVKSLAAELSRRVHTLSLSAAGVSKLQAAIVCALDLLDENVRLHAELNELKQHEND